MADRPRVLVLTASIGGGHLAASKALEQAFGDLGVPCLHVDLMDYTSAPFRRFYRNAYFDLVRTAPDFIDWLGKRMDRHPGETLTRGRRWRARLTRLASFQLPRLLHDYDPQIIVHTHFLPAVISSTLRQARPVQAMVVTDFAAHTLWMQPGIERYYVAADEVAVHLQACGVDRDRVRVTGIPIDRRFAHLPSKVEARARLGLSLDRDVVLVMAGGMDKRTLEVLLEQARRVKWPADLVVVCGRSPELMGVAARWADMPSDVVRIRAMGFTTEVPEWMAASDAVVGKPGGLTVSESLAAAAPFVVVQPYPLQEEANANFLLEHGCALRVDPLTTFGHKLTQLLADPGRREAASRAAASVARPHAADTVASDVLEVGHDARNEARRVPR